MSEINPEFKFKGDEFMNRYRIIGMITSKSPIHIGTGDRREDNSQLEKESGNNSDEEKHFIDKIARDSEGLPYIPGSALRGAIRNYLLQIFRSFNRKIADDKNYESDYFKNMDQDEQIEYIQNKASLLEQVFGTPFCETKVDFWDATLKNRADVPELAVKGWDNDGQSYVVRSVTIDPITGAAEPHKLYSFDVVPSGLQFEVNVVGQNLNNIEMGFLLFGLNGFNSEIYPLTIGAMSGRGFGMMKFEANSIYYLPKGDLPNWSKLALDLDHAGFNLFSQLQPADLNKMITTFKDAFRKVIRRAA